MKILFIAKMIFIDAVFQIVLKFDEKFEIWNEKKNKTSTYNSKRLGNANEKEKNRKTKKTLLSKCIHHCFEFDEKKSMDVNLFTVSA